MTIWFISLCFPKSIWNHDILYSHSPLRFPSFLLAYPTRYPVLILYIMYCNGKETIRMMIGIWENNSQKKPDTTVFLFNQNVCLVSKFCNNILLKTWRFMESNSIMFIVQQNRWGNIGKTEITHAQEWGVNVEFYPICWADILSIVKKINLIGYV